MKLRLSIKLAVLVLALAACAVIAYADDDLALSDTLGHWFKWAPNTEDCIYIDVNENRKQNLPDEPCLSGPNAAVGGGGEGLAWQPLKIGAGGFLTGISIAPDGTKLGRFDVYGAFTKVPPTAGPGAVWTQLFTANSLNRGEVEPGGSFGGTYEAIVAPSEPTRFYAVIDDDVMRSDDSGATWSNTDFVEFVFPTDCPGATDPVAPSLCLWGNHYLRNTTGQHMAVDPVNPDVVILGPLYSRPWITTDGGASWALLPATIPAPLQIKAYNLQTASANAGIAGIAFDPSGGVVGGRTQNIYLSSAGNGVYFSDDAGATWTQISDGIWNNPAPLSGPSATLNARVRDGVYYATEFYQDDRAPGDPEDNRPSIDSIIWKWDGATWTDISPPGDHPTGQYWMQVIPDPATPDRLVASNDCGRLVTSIDDGASWGPEVYADNVDSPTIDWLDAGVGCQASGQAEFDPLVTGRLWLPYGNGILYLDSGTGQLTSNFTYIDDSLGMEMLVMQHLLVPPGSSRFTAATWDRAIFNSPTANVSYPTDIWPDATDLPTRFSNAWGLDYAKTDPDFLVATVCMIYDFSGNAPITIYSDDAGLTWQRTATEPAGGYRCDGIDLSGWTLDAGSRYYTTINPCVNVTQPGCVDPNLSNEDEEVFENGVTSKRETSAANVNAAREFFYDTATDRIYYQSSNGTDPSNFPMVFHPSGMYLLGGSVAVSTPTNWIVTTADKKPPYYTKDGGATWQRLSVAGIPNTRAGWGGVNYYAYGTGRQRSVITADSVTPNKFYLFYTAADTTWDQNDNNNPDTCQAATVCVDFVSGEAGAGGACTVDADCQPDTGIYVSTDSGDTWTQVQGGGVGTPANGAPNGDPSFLTLFQAKLAAVPGQAGDLFLYNGGASGGCPSGHAAYSRDGGVTWTVIRDMEEVFAMGFGRPVGSVGGAPYPEVVAWGYLNGIQGLYRSLNGGEHWEYVDSDFGVYAPPVDIQVDSVSGRIFIATGDVGAVYADQ